MKASVLVIASIFFAPVALAQPEVAPSPAEKIKVLSWNIYMLPSFFGQGNIPRAEAIGHLLASSDYDVIVFQEAFHKKARKKMRRLLQSAFPFQAGPANTKLISLRTNSGLWIFSKHPILEAHSIAFTNRQGIDAMSRKGALLVELKAYNTHVQIIGTHLQNAGNQDIKQRQCAELYQRLLRKYERIGVPQLICGDFNINRYTVGGHYQRMLQTLDAIDGGMGDDLAYTYDRAGNDLQVEPGHEKDLIDYVLLRSNRSHAACTKRRIQKFQKPWDPHHMDLSDHYSIESELHFWPLSEALTVAVPK